MTFFTSKNNKSTIIVFLFILSLILLLLFNLLINGNNKFIEDEKNYLHIISNSNFDSILSKDKRKLILLNFNNQNSIPCQNLDSIFLELARNFKDSVYFCSVNIDSSKKITRDYHITSIPTIKFIIDKKEIFSTVGYLKETEIVFLIDKIINDYNLKSKKNTVKSQKN